MPLGFYDVGATPFIALQADQRVSYCLYVPKSLRDEKDPSTWRLIAAVHGTGRTATAYRDGFAALAERTRCIVLAPLFPVGLIEPRRAVELQAAEVPRHALRPAAAGDGR